MRRLAVVVAVAIAALGCKGKKPAAESVALSETHTTASKLAVVHFPPTFAPGQASDKVAVLSPLPSGPYDPAIEVYVGTNDKPVTSVVDEYSRILHHPFQESHGDWKEEKHAAGTCFKGFNGVETVATFTSAKGKKMRYRSCAFFALNHGFWLAYMAPEGTFAEDEALLRKIVDATEIRN